MSDGQDIAPNLEHLGETTRAVAMRSKDERITYVRRSRWIGYDAADAILQDFEDLLTFPKRARMPCRLLLADTNNGKTELLNHFLKKHPPDPNLDGEAVRIPVLMITANGPDERGLYDAMLRQLFQELSPRGGVRDRFDQLMDVLTRVQPGLIVVDEANTLIVGSTMKTRDCLNGLKHINNLLRIPIVAAGTREARNAFSTDPQIQNRFEPRELPLWKADRSFRRLLASFESGLPLRERSDLSSLEMAKDCISRTGGTIGEVSKLLEAATIWTIRNGGERITREALDSCSYRSPSARWMA